MLCEIQQARQYDRYDAQHGHADTELLFLRGDGFAQQPECLHVPEYTQQAGDSEHLDGCGRYRKYQAQVECVGGQTVDQAVETEAVAYSAQESFVFGVNQVGSPYP